MRHYFLIIASLSCFACASEDPKSEPADAGPSCSFTLGWGHRDANGGYQAFQDGDQAEITLGFQGFRYIQSVLRLEGVTATSAKHSARIVVEGQEPYVLTDTPVKVHEEGGALVTDEVLVFFNDLPIAELVGKQAEITLTAKAGGCTGSVKRSVVLRDDQSCIQQEDGGLSCGSTDGGP